MGPDLQILIHEMFESPLDEREVSGSRSRLFGLLDSPDKRQVHSGFRNLRQDLDRQSLCHGFSSKHLITLDQTTENAKNDKKDIMLMML